MNQCYNNQPMTTAQPTNEPMLQHNQPAVQTILKLLSPLKLLSRLHQPVMTRSYIMNVWICSKITKIFKNCVGNSFAPNQQLNHKQQQQQNNHLQHLRNAMMNGCTMSASSFSTCTMILRNSAAQTSLCELSVTTAQPTEPTEFTNNQQLQNNLVQQLQNNQ